MGYRLGIDLGTASVGLACITLDANKEPADIAYHCAHIFQEPVEPATGGGIGSTKASARGSARRTRRLIDRRASRLRDLASICELLKIDPQTVTSDDGRCLHEARSQATTKPIAVADLARVLFRMAKRRGYAGGFQVKKEGDEGQVEGGINQLRQLMQDANCDWFGQYLLHRFNSGETLKLKEAKPIGLYVSRDMVEAEFEQIWKIQSAAHPILNEKYKGKPLKDIFRNVIFYQRPLKSVAAMVGQCPLEPNLPRAPMSQPAAQAFRIEKQIADLRWGMGRRSQALSSEQKTVIRDVLTTNEKATFLQTYKALEKSGYPKPEHRGLNFDRPSRQELKGNSTLKAMEKLGLAEQWQTLNEGTQISIINFLADLGSPQEVDRKDWHLQYRSKGKNGKPGKLREFSPAMVEFINAMVASGKFDRLSKIGFDGGRSAYSIKALKKLTEKMRDGMDEYEATEALYPQPDKKSERLTHLAIHKPTGNIVVDVALRQMRYAVNNAIVAMGGEPPSEVVIELSRDMGLGLKRRGEIEKGMDKNQRERKKAKEDLEKNGHSATSTNIFRWRLWDEQGNNCPYCERKICLGAAVDGRETNLEHIIPRTLTRVGRQQDHIMLSHRHCNDDKGNRTPWQAWGHDADKWKIITERAKALEKKRRFAKARFLTLQDWKAEIINSDIINDFTNRQYHETSWISKLAAQWMRTVCSDVSVSRGAMTAHLRRIWGLNTVIPEIRFESGLPVFDTAKEKNIITKEEFEKYKPYWEGHNNNHSGAQRTDQMIEKRIDHRHHVIDALVIALTSRGLYQKMARNYKALSERAQAGERVKLKLSINPPLKNIRTQALDMIREHHITHKPDRHVGGSLFKGTAYGVTWEENDNDPNADPEQKLTLRKNLEALADDKSKPDAVRKELEKIASLDTRRLVIDTFDKRIAAGKMAKEALTNIQHPQYRNVIRQVKMLTDYSANTAKEIEFESRYSTPEKPHYKWLRHDNYAYLELTCTPGEKPNPQLITQWGALRQKNQPIPPNTKRFFKGDTVEDTKDGKHFIIKQMKAQNGGLFVLVPITETREVRDMASKDGLRTISGPALSRVKLIS